MTSTSNDELTIWFESLDYEKMSGDVLMNWGKYVTPTQLKSEVIRISHRVGLHSVEDVTRRLELLSKEFGEVLKNGGAEAPKFKNDPKETRYTRRQDRKERQQYAPIKRVPRPKKRRNPFHR